jgi:hypothetical protein
VIALLLLLWQSYEIGPKVYIASYGYDIYYSSETLGKTSYPLDDDVNHRFITLPTMEGQIPVSWEHEKIHACMHGHAHHFKTGAALKTHLEDEKYSEEEVATILAPCLLALESVDLRHNAIQGQTK